MPDMTPVDLTGTVGEVIDRLKARLMAMGLLDQGEGFNIYAGARNDGLTQLPWPTEEKWPGRSLRAQWIACFAVRGGSEGVYVHVEAIWGATSIREPSSRVLLALGKEWSPDRALEIANACARLLEAV